MKKNNANGIIITNICIIILLLFVCYKIVIYESRFKAVENDVKSLVSASESLDDMPVLITPEPTPSPTPEPVETPPPKKIYKLYISGSVNSPGIYSVEEGSRIADLIEKAGGANDDADLNSINLAAYVEDGRHVKIPSVSEGLTESAPVFADAEVSVAEVSGNEQTDKIVLPDSQNIYEKPKYTGIVNINSADADKLMSLPGVGEVIAQNIIDYRNQNGGFKSVEEIKNVPRIGDSVYKGLADKISIE